MERKLVLFGLLICTFLASISPAQTQAPRTLTKHHQRLDSSDFDKLSYEVSRFPYIFYSKSSRGGEFNAVSGKCSEDVQRVANAFALSEDYAMRSKCTRPYLLKRAWRGGWVMYSQVKKTKSNFSLQAFLPVLAELTDSRVDCYSLI